MLPIASDSDTARPLIESRSLRGRSFRLALVVMCVLLLSTPVLSQPDSAIPTPPAQVRGEVVMLTSELVVVKSTDGTSILIPLGKDSIVDVSLKVGEQAEVVVTQDRHVTSVKRLILDPLR